MGKNQRSQITMTDSEIAEFVDRSRIATLATVAADGRAHLVAMWYAVIDGEIWFETKTKSQKAVNLRRDDRVTVLIEDGQTYDTLRGISVEGRAEIVEDPDAMFAVGVSVWERYTGPTPTICVPPSISCCTSGWSCGSFPNASGAGTTPSSAFPRCRWAEPPRRTWRRPTVAPDTGQGGKTGEFSVPSRSFTE